MPEIFTKVSTLISTRILLVVFLFLVIESLHSQTFFKPDTYTTFDNRNVNVFILEGQSCVLNIDTSLIDTLILRDIATFMKILERADMLYSFYKTNLGFEPRGGNQKYGIKVNIFFGQPSCGAGCGYIGFKGVEVGFFDNIYFSIKNGILNNNPDGIIAYELGRNFFDFSNKILFPFRPNTFDRNGGFAEGFASLMTAYAYDEILKSPQERDLNENFRFIDYAEELFYGFISDSLAITENFLAQWDYKVLPSDLNFR
ncbi:MAG TPA: hypothetical protein PKD85_20375, partial [Saprospiraceae bacterium]|nr:hypothetical protein [Saprospiraceae bacterium]